MAWHIGDRTKELVLLALKGAGKTGATDFDLAHNSIVKAVGLSSSTISNARQMLVQEGQAAFLERRWSNGNSERQQRAYIYTGEEEE